MSNVTFVAEWMNTVNTVSVTGKLNARHPFVLLMTIKTYKLPSKHNRFIMIYYFRATCFDSLESSSCPVTNRPTTQGKRHRSFMTGNDKTRKGTRITYDDTYSVTLCADAIVTRPSVQ